MVSTISARFTGIEIFFGDGGFVKPSCSRIVRTKEKQPCFHNVILSSLKNELATARTCVVFSGSILTSRCVLSGVSITGSRVISPPTAWDLIQASPAVLHP